MPDVPNVPGVPALSSFSPNKLSLLVADVISLISFFSGPQWGIFLDGEPAFPYNSIIDVDYKQDWPVSDYTMEDGSFLSYDKVQLPFDVKVRISSDADIFSREALLSAVLAGANSLTLYDVVTPEQVYESCNITHVDFKRTSHSGVGMIVIDIWFVEIRITSTSTFSNTTSPTTAGNQNTGNVSPSSPSAQLATGIAPL